MPKQQEIEMSGDGVSRLKIADIEKAAETYVTVRDKRMKLTEQEVTAKTELLQVVLSFADQLPKDADGNKCYHYDDFVVILKPGKPNVKVKTDTAADEDADED